jgi:hypothetical protein
MPSRPCVRARTLPLRHRAVALLLALFSSVLGLSVVLDFIRSPLGLLLDTAAALAFLCALAFALAPPRPLRRRRAP